MSQASCISHLLPQLNKSHLVQSDIAPLIHLLKNEPLVTVQLIGHSFERRPIHLLTLGQGPIVIFAWTQMHGNEATATAAVFDLIDQLIGNKHASIKNWSAEFTIHILPMLNPDGAQRCIRQNAQSIDINRDAQKLQTPEGQILMGLVEQLAPDIGFNLHDQSPYYQCGKSANPATIAFLAPAFDVDKTIDTSRARAMMLIAHMNKAIQPHIPNCVARYDDTYSVRSFGDNIAARKVSTILIESGAAKGDDNRQVAREMNVLAMLCAFENLMHEEAPIKEKQSDKNFGPDVSDYFAIPENVPEALSSLLIRNLAFTGNHSYTAGVSIKQTARYSNTFIIDYTGDLHTQAGLVDFDAQGLGYRQGKTFSPTQAMTFSKQSYIAMLRKGYLQINDTQGFITNNSGYDICHTKQPLHGENAFVLQQCAYCLLADLKEPERILYAMLNGTLIDLKE
ncbi:MAG: putative deacylase [Alphaproteobacteria bacterium]|jgi:predicted deacylase